jgi:hypothetical protein
MKLNQFQPRCRLHSVVAADVDEGVAKPVSRREKKKREVLAVKTQKLKADILKKTTCVPSVHGCVCHTDCAIAL